MFLLQVANDTITMSELAKVIQEANETPNYYYYITFFITLIGSLIGVLSAFIINRMYENIKKKKYYKEKIDYFLSTTVPYTFNLANTNFNLIDSMNRYRGFRYFPSFTLDVYETERNFNHFDSEDFYLAFKTIIKKCDYHDYVVLLDSLHKLVDQHKNVIDCVAEQKILFNYKPNKVLDLLNQLSNNLDSSINIIESSNTMYKKNKSYLYLNKIRENINKYINIPCDDFVFIQDDLYNLQSELHNKNIKIPNEKIIIKTINDFVEEHKNFLTVYDNYCNKIFEHIKYMDHLINYIITVLSFMDESLNYKLVKEREIELEKNKKYIVKDINDHFNSLIEQSKENPIFLSYLIDEEKVPPYYTDLTS